MKTINTFTSIALLSFTATQFACTERDRKSIDRSTRRLDDDERNRPIGGRQDDMSDTPRPDTQGTPLVPPLPAQPSAPPSPNELPQPSTIPIQEMRDPSQPDPSLNEPRNPEPKVPYDDVRPPL